MNVFFCTYGQGQISSLLESIDPDIIYWFFAISPHPGHDETLFGWGYAHIGTFYKNFVPIVKNTSLILV